QPLPKTERLRMRVINPENPNAVLDPEERHAQELAPQRTPFVALEVERVDILVLLRRVLRVFDRSVGPMAEPLRVLGDPRMVGRALPREIEGDLEAKSLRLRAKGIEIGECAERWIDRGMTA